MKSVYSYIIKYLMQQSKIVRVEIKPAWLNYLVLNVRPYNQFYATTESEKAQILKLKNNLGLQNQKDVTLHHILPGNQIITIIENCRGQDPLKVNRTCDLLSNHCNNNPAIRDRVQLLIKNSQFRRAIEVCWSSIFWFRRNLVLGPKEDRRSDDPGDNFDQPLFNQQGNNYQEIMKNCKIQILNRRWNQALDFFLKLTPTNNVIWKYNAKQDNWSVSGKSVLPGNVGFDY